MAFRLTEQQSKILCAAQFHATAPVTFLKKKTGYRDHAIHYQLNRFRDEGIIRRAAFLNVYALGYTQYEVYFSLAAKEKSTRDRVLKFCEESPRIAWYAELGGNFQYGMTVVAKGGNDFNAFLESLAQRFGNIFVKKSLALVVSFTLFRKKYLMSPCPWNDSLSFQETEKPADFDALDQKILSALFLPGYESVESLARQIREPRTTVDLRMRRLEERGVIAGYVYLINARMLQMLTYKVLIYAKGIPEGLSKKLFEFCAKEPHVVNFLRSIGSWDYELTVEVENNNQMVRLTEEIYSAFGGLIQDVEILPVFHQAQSKNYMRFPAAKAEKAGK